MADRTCEVEGCNRGGKLTRKMCAKHYRYWIDHTPKAERGLPPRAQREFWDFVTKSHEHGCWTWTGTRNRQGYGYWGKVLAHRHSWSLANGPIPAGMWVLHHCDNPPCVNPRHLYLGTVVENARDAADRGRIGKFNTTKTHCPKGHPFDDANTYRLKNGHRQCKDCNRAWARERARRRRAANHGSR